MNKRIDIGEVKADNVKVRVSIWSEKPKSTMTAILQDNDQILISGIEGLDRLIEQLQHAKKMIEDLKGI